jgi:hypothetical protein
MIDFDLKHFFVVLFKNDFFLATVTGGGFVWSLDIANALLQFGVLVISFVIGIYGLINAIKKHRQK